VSPAGRAAFRIPADARRARRQEPDDLVIYRIDEGTWRCILCRRAREEHADGCAEPADDSDDD
jgi:hypothetical protein